MREVQLNGFIEEEAWCDDDISPDTLHDALYVGLHVPFHRVLFQGERVHHADAEGADLQF